MKLISWCSLNCLAREIKEDTSSSPHIFVLYEIILDDIVYSWKFSVRGYLPLIWFHYSIPLLAVYVKEGLPSAQDLSQKNSADSYLCFRLALLHSVFYFFSSIDHFLHYYARFLILLHWTYRWGSLDQPICYSIDFSINSKPDDLFCIVYDYSCAD